MHFGLACANDVLFSFVIEMIDVALPAEGGPEFDVKTVVTLADRLDVKLINEPFDNPKFFFNYKNYCFNVFVGGIRREKTMKNKITN